MATDYSKKTNAELVEILKTRSLPHTGKKADMVSRLQEHDENKPSDSPAAAPAAAKTDAAEDVIDWDDEPAETIIEPSTETGAAAIAAGGQGAVSNPVAVPNQQLDENPATTEDLKVEATGAVAEPTTQPEAATEQKPAVDYTRGLPQTDLEAELEKRKARAQKFGIVEDDDTALKEATKQLERAKRFGTGAEAETTSAAGVSRLDQALPDERSRKRRNDARTDSRNDQGGRGGKRRDTGRNRNNRQRGDGNRGDGNRNRGDGNKTNAGVKKPNAGGNTAQKSWSEKDNAAMEARKKRFAAAA
ncbi:DNA-binding SAP [Penicillium fimorum]|uniref:DNA-binding SAP n=1 Tax=Penicillium fimorum TaxID=1882269 RepID=A0A9W9Y0I9_9EURO|nr:DNA-binding SAP [Penicillium fimorum]